MRKKRAVAVWVSLLAALAVTGLPARWAQAGDPVLIQDRQGESWEITGAVRLGFEPERFHHGLGRGAIVPLEGGDVTASPEGVQEDLEVIGVALGGEALAVSVKRLEQHEVANVRLGGTPAAVAY